MDSLKDTGIRVEIEQELAVIVPEYLEKRSRDCISIERLLAEKRWDTIQLLGHQMKGTGGSFGFDEISEIGEALENAALDGNDAGIRAAVERLLDYLSRVIVTYI